MRETRDNHHIIIVDKKTGEWEVVEVEYKLIREYITNRVCIYHTWEEIICTMEELTALQKKYPIVVATELTIRPEEENNVPF